MAASTVDTKGSARILLEVLEPGRRIVGTERDRVAVDIVRAVRGGETCASVAGRINRSPSWVKRLVADYDAGAMPADLRGEKRRTYGEMAATEWGKGVSVVDLAALLKVERPTVIQLLRERGIDAGRRKPRPSRTWRLWYLPASIRPANLDAEPSDDEWELLDRFLEANREVGVFYKTLAEHTGLSIGTVRRRVMALPTRPGRRRLLPELLPCAAKTLDTLADKENRSMAEADIKALDLPQTLRLIAELCQDLPRGKGARIPSEVKSELLPLALQAYRRGAGIREVQTVIGGSFGQARNVLLESGAKFRTGWTTHKNPARRRRAVAAVAKAASENPRAWNEFRQGE